MNNQGSTHKINKIRYILFVSIIEVPAADAAELQTLLNGMVKGDDPGADAILMIVEPLLVTPDPFLVIAEYAYQYQVPMGGTTAQGGDYASIFGVNVSSYKSGELAAPLADKVLKGTKAGTIPVVSSDSFIQINLKAAQLLGVTVPDGLLAQAEQIDR